MSAAHEGHEAEAHDAKDAAADHAFDGEPTHVLPPDEPRTPGWVPALGVLLFLTAVIAFLIRSGSDAGASEPAAAAPKPTHPAAAAEPVRAPPVPAGLQPSRPPPAATGSSPVPMPTPEQIQQIRRAIEERARQQGAASAAPGSPPPPIVPR
jgi:hypothetical protein